MTHSIQLHPLSVLVGLGIAVLAVVTMAQSDLQATQIVEVVKPVQISPHPRDFVQIENNGPYTVPLGKIFTVTALGRANAGNTVTVALFVDGLKRVETLLNTAGITTLTVSVPQGLTVQAGSVITVMTSGSPPKLDGQVWGYLSDQ